MIDNKEYYRVDIVFIGDPKKITFNNFGFVDWLQTEDGERGLYENKEIRKHGTINKTPYVNKFNIVAYIPKSYDLNRIKSVLFGISFNGNEPFYVWLGDLYVEDMYNDQTVAIDKRNAQIKSEQEAEAKRKAQELREQQEKDKYYNQFIQKYGKGVMYFYGVGFKIAGKYIVYSDYYRNPYTTDYYIIINGKKVYGDDFTHFGRISIASSHVNPNIIPKYMWIINGVEYRLPYAEQFGRLDPPYDD